MGGVNAIPGGDSRPHVAQRHAEVHRKFRNNPFLTQNVYYKADEDYYVCPMGQQDAGNGGRARSKSTFLAACICFISQRIFINL